MSTDLSDLASTEAWSDPRVHIRPDVKGWWDERLTDGSYYQLQEQLTDGWVTEPDGHGHAREACCLGVLAGVAIEHGAPHVRWHPERSGFVQVFDVERYERVTENLGSVDEEDFWGTYEDGSLPEPVVRWAFGVTGDVTGYENPVLTTSGWRAIGLNDEEGWGFEAIAAAVRQLPEVTP